MGKNGNNKKIVDIADAQIVENDISIALKLPSKTTRDKQVRVRFAKCIKRFISFKAKKNEKTPKNSRILKFQNFEYC